MCGDSYMLDINLNEIYTISFRALLSLIALFFITKMIGKKQISELSLFDYVISISIGNFAAEITLNKDISIISGFVAVLIYGLIGLLVSFLTMKSIKLRRYMIGDVTILIDNGEFIYDNFKRTRMDINDFLQTCRIAGYFNVSEIKYALMEPNGKISFLPKEKYLPVNNKDLNIKTEKNGLCANVIVDGNLMKENLYSINKDEAWLNKELKKQGYNSYDNIILACIDPLLKLKIFESKEIKNKKNILE